MTVSHIISALSNYCCTYSQSSWLACLGLALLSVRSHLGQEEAEGCPCSDVLFSSMMQHQCTHGKRLQNTCTSPCCSRCRKLSLSMLHVVASQQICAQSTPCCLQSLAAGLHSHKADAPPAVSRASSAQLKPARQSPGPAQQAGDSQHLALHAAPHQQQQQQQEAGHQHARASLRRATEEAEQGLQQHAQEVQRQMQSMQGTFQEVCQSLQSLQAAFQHPQPSDQPQPQPAATHSRHKVCSPARAPVNSQMVLHCVTGYGLVHGASVQQVCLLLSLLLFIHTSCSADCNQNV